MRRAAFILLLLAGCTFRPVPSLSTRMSVYIGDTETQLVQGLGVPTRSYAVGGRKFLAYDDRHLDVIPGDPGFGPWGPPFGFGWYGGFPPQVVETGCETTFEVKQGHVVSFSLRGNACG
ncbi:MAG TPA: hypothetical protein VMU82_17525 [Acetobacteraceae bacterium]|nr:hypothetical protein [Acetobacteraceae bacterium]